MCALVLGGCAGDDFDPLEVFAPSVTDVVFEVDYEEGAEPFVGNLPNGNSRWNLTRNNVEAMFGVTPARTFTIPDQLAQMENLGAIDDGVFSVSNLLSIADQASDETNTSSRKVFHVLFLDGYLDDGGEPNEGVLGVSIGGTRTIAMFKPVIDSTSAAGFVEQTTLVHEFGHAIGLVNNGVPLQSEHHDHENGAHCTNDKCVMYFANEGKADLADFVRRLVVTGDDTVFGPECQADVEAVRGDE